MEQKEIKELLAMIGVGARVIAVGLAVFGVIMIYKGVRETKKTNLEIAKLQREEKDYKKNNVKS